MREPDESLHDPLIPKSEWCRHHRKDEGKQETSLKKRPAKIGFQESEPGSDSAAHGSGRLNGYALAGAILAAANSAAANSVLLGYDIGVMSGVAMFIKEDLKITSTQVEILVGSLNVVSLFGSLASGQTSDWIGRRWTIVLAASTFFVGAILMGLAPSFPFLIAGRVVGVGFSLMIAPVYVAELSPAMARGFLSSIPEVFIALCVVALCADVSFFSIGGVPDEVAGPGHEPGRRGEPAGERGGGDVVPRHLQRDYVCGDVSCACRGDGVCDCVPLLLLARDVRQELRRDWGFV